MEFVCERGDRHEPEGARATEIVARRVNHETVIAGYRCLVCGFTDVDGMAKEVDPDFINAYLDPEYI